MVVPRAVVPVSVVVALAWFAGGCASEPDEPAASAGTGDTSAAGDTSAGETSTSTTATGDGDGDAGSLVGLDLMTRLAGLWTGAATMTPLGTFETMHMDLRAVAGHTLFARADLDAENSLRFAFAIETIGGQDQLVYRNGGYFLGTLRDSRTTIVEHGESSWRFCAVDGGCDYIDATWELQSETELVLDVKVKGQQHLLWIADRVEARALPEPFPADASPQGAGDAPFPAMPSLRVTVSWSDPLVDAADVYVLLSAQDCPLAGFCEFSRSIRGAAEAGATSVELVIDQVHAGSYKANAIVDRNQDLETSLFPGDGDAVSLPNQPVSVADEGESTASLVALVEL